MQALLISICFAVPPSRLYPIVSQAGGDKTPSIYQLAAMVNGLNACLYGQMMNTQYATIAARQEKLLTEAEKLKTLLMHLRKLSRTPRA